MKKYLYLLAGLAAGFVLVFMGAAICQYLHLTQSGYVRYDDSVEVVYQQVAEYAGVDPATLSIHAKRQVGDDIFVLWKTPDRTEVSMTQLRQASVDVDQGIGIGIGAGRVIDPDRRFAALEADLAHRHADAGAAMRGNMDFFRSTDRAGGHADFGFCGKVSHGQSFLW